MKILILGAGQVGGTLAESLAKESFDITLIDQDGDRLRCLLYTSPSPRDGLLSRMPSSA